MHGYKKLYEGDLNENDNVNEGNQSCFVTQFYMGAIFNENDNFRNGKLIIHGFLQRLTRRVRRPAPPRCQGNGDREKAEKTMSPDDTWERKANTEKEEKRRENTKMQAER